MVYRTFLFQTFITLITLLLLYGLIVYFFYERPVSTNWIEQCYKIKDDYARSIKGEKIVFSAGSNVLMGVNTAEIEKTLGIPTVNHAVHFLLAADYTIYRTKKILNRGDTVVMSLEYASILWDSEVSDTLAGYLLTNDKTYIHTLPILRQLKIIYSIMPGKFYKVLLTKIPSVRQRLLNHGYSAKTLNKNGDETANIVKEPDPSLVASRFEKTKDDLLSYKGLRSLIKFSRWCRDNGIRFYFQYPNMMKIDESDKKDFTDFQQRLEKILTANDIEILGTADDSFFGPKYLFDTTHHLNQEGMHIRTQKIIKALQKADQNKKATRG